MALKKGLWSLGYSPGGAMVLGVAGTALNRGTVLGTTALEGVWFCKVGYIPGGEYGAGGVGYSPEE